MAVIKRTKEKVINKVETIFKIKNFFKSLDIDSDNILSTLEKLQNEEEVVKRYYLKITEANREENNSLKVNSNTLNPDSTFCVIYENKEILNLLKKILKDDISFSKQFSSFCIKSKHSELFLKIWSKYKYKISWRSLSDERRFNWTYKNINKGIEIGIWDWSELSKNPSLPWDFNFVEKYKDYLQWKYVKVNNYLKWNEKLINKYSNYIFSSDNIENRSELTFCKELIDQFKTEFELNHNIEWNNSIIEKYDKNWNWISLSKNSKIIFDDFIINKYSNNWDFSYLSQSPNLKISPETIQKHWDKWNCDILIRNKSIKLEFSTIEKLKDLLDWNYIIIQPHLFWDEKLIDKYSDYIFRANNEIDNKRVYGSYYKSYCEEINHSGYFESNENVLWNDSLIDKYADKLNWDYLCKNSKIHFTEFQLEKYKNYINWEVFFNYGNTNWNELIIDKYFIPECLESLVCNNHITWSNSMFKKYIENSNLYILSKFCKNAKITNDLIVKNQSFWSSKEVSVKHKFKFSDFGTYYENTYHSLWKNLFENINIIWDDMLLESYIEKIILNEMYWAKLKLSVNFINKYWDFSKEENIWHIGNYDTGTYSEKSIVYLRDYFSRCEIIDLNLKMFIKNEFKWINSSLINEYSINNSIENLILSEYNK